MHWELNCLSYWFPKILDAGLPVPRTKIVVLPGELREPMMRPIDGKPFGEECKPWIEDLRAAAKEMGTPCFLRTGQTSGKHQWKDCCYLDDPAALEHHIVSLINFSECADIFGLPWNVWCVREFLETSSPMDLDDYGGMPVCREFRCFVCDGSVVCIHPYWPKRSIMEGMFIPESLAGKPLRYLLALIDKTYDRLIDDSDQAEVRELAERAGKAVPGNWSIDVLDTEDGWYVTDMATASDSFHWEGCEHAKLFNSQGGG